MKFEEPTGAVAPPFEQGVMAQVPKRVDDNGRCCGRKPLHYKGSPRPRLFCPRCDREFDPATGVQRANWAWKPAPERGSPWESRMRSAMEDPRCSGPVRADFAACFAEIERLRDAHNPAGTGMREVMIERERDEARRGLTAIRTQVANALRDLEDGDDEEAMEMLRAIAGLGA